MGEILIGKLNRFTYIKILTLFGTVLFLFSLSFAQKIDRNATNTDILKRNTRSKRIFKSAFSQQTRGNSRFIRSVLMDGNLVTGGLVNIGAVGNRDIGGTPIIGWPKGSKWVNYIYTTDFYVAAEVKDINGDTIHVISDHWTRSGGANNQAPDGTHLYAFEPLPGYYNLDQPESEETPLVYGISEDVGMDGFPRTHDRGEGDGILQPPEDFNGNGVLDLSMKNVVGWYALSSRKETWPRWWPVGSYPGDPRKPGDKCEGPRAGYWNGEYGAYIRADQESYYVMDDRENDRFKYFPFENDHRSWPDGQRGLGLKVTARAYQWNARLAEDILISIFDVTLRKNAKPLKKCVVGMWVDPDLGSSQHGDDAWFNTKLDITFAWNRVGLASNGLPIGYLGFAFLESPGLAHDGIDNDEDGMVDESQNNGIDDDHDWRPWEDTNGNGKWDCRKVNGHYECEPLNDDLGHDGLGPNDPGYPGPDEGQANGVPDAGEPNFDQTDNDESDQVGLTSMYLKSTDNRLTKPEEYWQTELIPGTFKTQSGYQNDICWTYGSGYVEWLKPGETHRYAIAMLFGNDKDDIIRNKRTMQVIYDHDYNFAKAPNKPILVATGGNKKVYLSWDNNAEYSYDPVYGYDFEAYYIYKSTEPSFTDIKTITDAFGNPLLFKPLVIFDKKDGLKGPHPVSIGSEIGPESDLGVHYNMGTDSGLKHFYEDDDVDNGRTYYYAVVSVDKGYDPSFYPKLSPFEGLQPIPPTECTATIQTDPLGRPISFDRNTAEVIPTEPMAGWVEPSISKEGVVHKTGNGTGHVDVKIINPFKIKPGEKYMLEFKDDGAFKKIDSTYTGNLSFMNIYDKTLKEDLVGAANPTNNTELFVDGFQVLLFNDKTALDTSYWEIGSSKLTVDDITDDIGGTRVPRDYEVRVMQAGADTSYYTHKPANFQVWDITDPDNPLKEHFFYFDTGEKGVLSENDQIELITNKNKILWGWKFHYPEKDSTDKTLPKPGDVFKILSNKTFDRNDTFEFSMTGNIISNSKAKDELKNIYVVPDPYIAYNGTERIVVNDAEGMPPRKLDFVGLPDNCTVKIFTSAGKMVRKLEYHSTGEKRRLTWDMLTFDGLEIASGIYFYVVEAPGIGKKIGRFAVIK